MGKIILKVLFIIPSIILSIGCYDSSEISYYELDRITCLKNSVEVSCIDFPIRSNLRDFIYVYRIFSRPRHGRTQTLIVSSMLEHLYNHPFVAVEPEIGIIETEKIVYEVPVSCGGIWLQIRLKVHLIFSDEIKVIATLYEDTTTVNIFCPEYPAGNRYTMSLIFSPEPGGAEIKYSKETDNYYSENAYRFYLPFSLFETENLWSL